MYYKAKITENKRLNNEAVYSLRLQGDFAAEAGQFYLLTLEGAPSKLPRPISVHDVGAGYIRFCYQVNGCGTRKLSEMNVGTAIELRGPYGVELAGIEKGIGKQGDERENCAKKRVALVSGGVGAAPFLLAAKMFQKKGWCVDLYAGFRDEVIPLDDFIDFCAQITIITESGRQLEGSWQCKKGLVTEFFLPAKYDLVYTCGPHAMMRAVCEMCRGAVPSYALLEQKMACGVGVCRGCVVKTISGNKDICRQGPALLGEEIVWDV